MDRRQHIAEKLHSFNRDDGDRPSTRVTELMDLVLLIESGLAPDTSVVDAARRVFAVRVTHKMLTMLPNDRRAGADLRRIGQGPHRDSPSTRRRVRSGARILECGKRILV
ncbi:hypothetical protein [Nocardia heshunensis]